MPKLSLQARAGLAMPVGICGDDRVCACAGDLTLIELRFGSQSALGVGRCGRPTLSSRTRVTWHQLGIATGSLTFFPTRVAPCVAQSSLEIVLRVCLAASLERLSLDTAALARRSVWCSSRPPCSHPTMLSLMAVTAQPLRGPLLLSYVQASAVKRTLSQAYLHPAAALTLRAERRWC